jgi:hypothetical protein
MEQQTEYKSWTCHNSAFTQLRVHSKDCTVRCCDKGRPAETRGDHKIGRGNRTTGDTGILEVRTVPCVPTARIPRVDDSITGRMSSGTSRTRQFSTNSRVRGSGKDERGHQSGDGKQRHVGTPRSSCRSTLCANVPGVCRTERPSIHAP